eukprot:1938626-Amphidinium_carterae.1
MTLVHLQHVKTLQTLKFGRRMPLEWVTFKKSYQEAAVVQAPAAAAKQPSQQTQRQQQQVDQPSTPTNDEPDVPDALPASFSMTSQRLCLKISVVESVQNTLRPKS